MTLCKLWVTGGTGFLGSRVVLRLIEQGHEVSCLVRNRNAAAQLSSSLPSARLSQLKIVLGSLSEANACSALVAGGDVGIHIASSLTGSASALFMGNVVATRTLLRAVRASGVNRFVLVSSIAVYGTQGLARTAVLDETCPIDPTPHLRDPYTFSKVVQENVCWEARREWNLPLVVVRPGVIFGPGRDCLSARVGLKVGNLLVRMGGRQPLPYTFVDNCAGAVVRAAMESAVEGEAFNIVDDRLPTGLQLIREHRRRVGPIRTIAIPLWAMGPLARWYTAYAKYSRGQLPSVLTPYRVSASWNTLRYSNDKARARLGWKCEISLEEGLRATFSPS